MLMDTHLRTHRGFTIVELLIVVVVIAILAAITIVAYTGIRQSAIRSSVASDLSSAVKTLQVFRVTNDRYPTDLTSAGLKSSNGTVFAYTADAANPTTFCLTAYNASIKYLESTDHTSTKRAIACAGARSTSAEYCPESSHVQLNGYYCDGTVGSTASLNSPVRKQLATASGVPANAPSYFVGEQTTRDNIISSPFTVAAGEVYCASGYAATTASTVTHTIGLMLNGSGVSTNWLGVNTLSPSTTWQRLNGCITIPAGYTNAQFWTQNAGWDGDGTATPAWYHSALTLTKQ